MVSTPNYIIKSLHKFQNHTPRCAQYAPYQRTRPNYGATKQLSTPLDTSPPIPEELKRRIQKNVGAFLFYDRTVDCTMIPAFNTIAKQQSKSTQNNEAAITQFLYYAATNLSVIFQYKSSNMILHIDNDASYLSEPWICSRTGGLYYLRFLPADPEKSPNLPPP